MIESTAADTLQNQLSGYGSRKNIVINSLSLFTSQTGQEKPLNTWDEEDVHLFVKLFIECRFPTILVMNKCDAEGSDTNLSRACIKYGEVSCLAPCECVVLHPNLVGLFQGAGCALLCSRRVLSEQIKAAELHQIRERQ